MSLLFTPYASPLTLHAVVKTAALYLLSLYAVRNYPNNGLLTRFIHDGSLRNRAVALRDGHAEP